MSLGYLFRRDTEFVCELLKAYEIEFVDCDGKQSNNSRIHVPSYTRYGSLSYYYFCVQNSLLFLFVILTQRFREIIFSF